MQVVILAFCVGLLVGVSVGVGLTWWYMNWQWRKNPYRFKSILDGVIALRGERNRAQ